MPVIARKKTTSEWLILSCGIWSVGLGLYFFFRPALLPEDLAFMHMTIIRVRAEMPELENWLSKVFMVIGGFIAGSGLLTIYLAVTVLPSRPKGISIVLALFGALTFAVMSVINFNLNSVYKWPLLFPFIIWVLGLVLYLKNPRPSFDV
ncbi:MAG: hypothetical protein H7249_13815 [Chitinophagaceae bacterium]|nr:hypothetical protein [Oligoflexus sp.]